MADEPWQVRIALDPAEVEAIVGAMFAVAPRDRWGMSEPEDDAFPVLVIASQTESQVEAEAGGRELYREAREQARLPASDARILGVLSPIWAAAPHDRLLDEAEALFEDQRYDLAVLRAQTACELYAGLALDRIARDLADGDRRPRSLFRKVWLGDRADRALFQALTGAEIARQDWWESYRRHVALRNEIVHSALPASRDQAADSIQAARAFVRFLQEQWTRGDPAQPGWDEAGGSRG